MSFFFHQCLQVCHCESAARAFIMYMSYRLFRAPHSREYQESRVADKIVQRLPRDLTRLVIQFMPRNAHQYLLQRSAHKYVPPSALRRNLDLLVFTSNAMPDFLFGEPTCLPNVYVGPRVDSGFIRGEMEYV